MGHEVGTEGELARGSQVDHFKILRLVGRGGMGEVYLARDTHLGRRVALKVIHRDILGDEDARLRFLNEARLTASFSHPHIITLYHVGEMPGRDEEDTSLYVALEYLEGQSLQERMEEGNIGLKEALRLVKAIADAVREAHRHGVLHRDLKPANVMIPLDGRLRVLDFGLAKQIAGEAPRQGEVATRQGEVATRQGEATTGREERIARGSGEGAEPEVCSAPKGTEETLAASSTREPELVAGARRAVGSADDAVKGSQSTLPISSVKGDEGQMGEAGETGSSTSRRPRLTLNHSLAPDSYQTQQGGLLGSPAYMAPEQWLEEPTTPATDVWALGLILYELATGHHPYAGLGFYKLCLQVASTDPVPTPKEVAPKLAALPQALMRLIDACLAKDPSARPSAQALVDALDTILADDPRDTSGDENPFRGLLPFGERHAAQFYGRGAEIDAFLERIRHDSVLPVVGPSGAGKSSFVQAGIIPRLKEQGPLSVLRVRPGRRPFLTLATRLLSRESSADHAPGATPLPEEGAHGTQGAALSGDRPAQGARRAEAMVLAGALQEEPGRLALALLEIAERQACEVLLFIDQLEELYTLVPEERAALRPRFMEAIVGAADDVEGPVRVVFTLRDDFLGRIAEAPSAREALGRVTVLRTPDPKALEEILLRPVAAAGFSYEDPKLVEEMVAGVSGERSALPLLQFASRELWTRRDLETQRITRAAYEAIGGVEGALARHADDVIDGLGSDEASTARSLLLHLVTPEGTRAVVPEHEILEGLVPDAGLILDVLVRQRIVLARKGLDEPEFELVHESLIVAWKRLSRWLDESRDARRFVAETGQAAFLWDRRGRLDDEVWVGAALAEAQSKASRIHALPAQIREFLEAGMFRARRTRRRRRVLFGGAFVLSVLVALSALGVSWVVSQKEREAQGQRRRAEAQMLVSRQRRADAIEASARTALARGHLLEARARLRAALELRDSRMARALWWRLRRDALVWQEQLGDVIYRVRVSPDGGLVAAASQNHVIYLLNMQTARRSILRGDPDPVLTVDFSPDGKHLLSGDWAGRILIWDLTTGLFRRLGRVTGSLRGVAYSPDGRRVLTGGSDSTVKIWNVETGQELAVLRGHQGTIFDVAYAPGGDLVASASRDGSVRLWDLKTGRERARLLGHHGPVFRVVFGPRGAVVATGGMDRSLRLWDVKTGRQVAIFRGHRSAVTSVALSPDGRRAVAANGHELRLWDVKTGRELGVFLGHRAGVNDVCFSPRGDRIVSVSLDRNVCLWDPKRLPQQRLSGGHRSMVYGLAFAPKGDLLASGGQDKTVRLWDVKTGRSTMLLAGHHGGVWTVAFSPKGDILASGSPDKTLRLWDVKTGRQRAVLRGNPGGVWTLAFNPRGDLLASGGLHGAVRLWDVKTHRQGLIFRGHRGAIRTVVFSPRGDLVASSGVDRTVRLWDVKTGHQRAVLRGHKAAVWGLAFDPKGDRLASGGGDKTVRLWDVHTGRLINILPRQPGRILWLAFSPDGKHLGLPEADGIARVWDLASGRFVSLRGHRGDVNTFRFGPHGELAATASDDGTVRLWNAHTGQALWRAPFLHPVTTELFSHRGWQRLDGEGRPPLGSPPRRWRRAIETKARLSSVAPSGELLCLGTHDDQLQIWDLAQDRRLVRQALPGLTQVLAIPGACLTLAKGILRRQARAGGAPQTVLGKQAPVSAMTWVQGELIASAGHDIHLLGPHGHERARVHGGFQASAVGRVGPWLIAGYRDGDLELLSANPGVSRPHFSFEELPSSAVVRIVAGPKGSVIAGFANGMVGLWNLQNGALLDQTKLHGPAIRLLRKGQTLFMVSELGDHQVWDLGLFSKPYCSLLREVWAEVPLSWRDGMAHRASIPPKHLCAP